LITILGCGRREPKILARSPMLFHLDCLEQLGR
jgi:hypothetical protein